MFICIADEAYAAHVTSAQEMEHSLVGMMQGTLHMVVSCNIFSSASFSMLHMVWPYRLWTFCSVTNL